MYLHELNEVFHEECSLKSLDELRKQVCSHKRSIADGDEEDLSHERIVSISSASEASVMNKSFLYAAEALSLYINNISVFLNNDISFARYIANMKNFFENFEHMEFTEPMELGALKDLTQAKNSKLLNDVVFISSIIASSYRVFLTQLTTESANLVDSINICFLQPLVDILSSITISLHSGEDVDSDDLNTLISKSIANFAEITLLPLANLLRRIDKVKHSCSASTCIRPEQVDLPLEADILREANRPICDVVDVFMASHVDCQSVEHKQEFTRLYRESLTKKGLIADKNDLSSLMYEASLILANHREMKLRLTT